MTFRQRLLRLLYPAYIKLGRFFGRHRTVLSNSGRVPPAVPIYAQKVKLANGQELPLERFRGRKLLLVNTASDCIYTAQYQELQELMAHYGDGLVVIAFPSNDFKEQERGGDAEISNFCQMNYGVTFPVAHKASVRNGAGQQEVFRWLTDKSQNGWNTKPPSWNFSKYLVNEQGVLTHYFDPAISPKHPELLRAIHHG
ncbi:glutathione peroxidase [Flaviaesturariibacter flavus]|uniref:Glutathione peroxidase n=2 Tax=Flaviaesturariibacter flavus TaxID=2502780 RepID=A0A4R1BC51_9BACT|nr:glutathione peroxidase [Flaviaesturariibacter flavus]